MNNKKTPGLLLGFSMWSATANAAQLAITCDRECLRRQEPRCGSVHEILSGEWSSACSADSRIVCTGATATQTQPEDGTDTSGERVIPEMP